MTQRLADTDGLAVGSTLTILGAGEPAQYRIVGIVAGDGPPDVVDGRTVFVPLDTAQSIFDETGVTRVDVGLEPDADVAAVTAALEAGLLVEPYVVSSPEDLADSLRASTADFQATTAMIAAIALFTGAFLIFNTLSMTVIERFREVGLLRAAGATRVQVRTFILTQALVVGFAGSAIGIVFGALLATAMVAYLRTIGSVTLDEPGRCRSSMPRPPSRSASSSPSRRRSSPPGGPRGSHRSRRCGRASTCRPPGAPAFAGLSSCSWPSPLAGLLIWPRDAVPPGRSEPSPCTRCCSSRRCSSRSSCRPSRALAACRSASRSGSRSGSRARRCCATGVGPR